MSLPFLRAVLKIARSPQWTITSFRRAGGSSQKSTGTATLLSCLREKKHYNEKKGAQHWNSLRCNLNTDCFSPVGEMLSKSNAPREVSGYSSPQLGNWKFSRSHG